MEYSKWKFSFKEGVWGHVTSPPSGRWLVWDAPWTEDVRAYGCPQRFKYFGKKWHWSIGAKTQCYDWKRSVWSREWKRFVVSPANHKERFIKKYGKEARYDWETGTILPS
mgnify:CR=1 FL=1